MWDGSLRTPLRSGKGLALRRAEEEESSPTPLLVCRLERRPQFGMAIEVEAAAAEDGVTPGGNSTAKGKKYLFVVPVCRGVLSKKRYLWAFFGVKKCY